MLTLICGVAAGAALMFFLDPHRGARRRALLRDKTGSFARQARRRLARRVIDARNRSRGIVANAASALRSKSVDDDQLCERVRSAIGRAIHHPRSIEVHADQGTITLSGPIFSHEVDELIETVAHVRGVVDVIHNLEEHSESENVPGLQGGRRTRRH
jgi:osmotically-inducible protein OsmY